MAIPKELLQQLLKDYKNPEDLLGENGILKELTKGLVEAALGAELTEHLGYEKHDTAEKPSENRRNGASKKTIRTDHGEVEIEVPRDRDASFVPKLVGKHQKEIPGFSDKILSMYARGMSTREITEHLKERSTVRKSRRSSSVPSPTVSLRALSSGATVSLMRCTPWCFSMRFS